MDYTRNSKNYELFIRKVFNCKPGKRYGADEKLMIKLFLNQQGQLENNQRIPASRQFFKVKLYIQRALIKSKKKKKYVNASKFFDEQIVKLQTCDSPEALGKIINTSFRKVIELESKYRNRI